MLNKRLYYRGYSYPGILDNCFVHWIWKRLFCTRGWHLWDECKCYKEHYLYCDCCDETVEIWFVWDAKNTQWLDRDYEMELDKSETVE